MEGQFKKLMWFLRRPSLYPQLMRLTLKKARPSRSRLDHTRAEATEWCKRLAIDTNMAIREITGQPPPKPFGEKHRAYLESGKVAVHSCVDSMGGAAALDLLYWVAEHVSATKVVETGVAYGWSSLALLLSMHNRPESQLISTDMPYPCRQTETHVGCVVPDELRSIWTLVKCADREALPKALRTIGAIDMCHYDSDKSYDGRTWAYKKLWTALRYGGVFISDDINDNLAFRDFANSLTIEPIVTSCDGKYIGVLIKNH